MAEIDYKPDASLGPERGTTGTRISAKSEVAAPGVLGVLAQPPPPARALAPAQAGYDMARCN